MPGSRDLLGRYSVGAGKNNDIISDILTMCVSPTEIEIVKTDVYARWFAKLRDRQARL